MLSVTIGPRVSGTDAELEARDYLADELRSYGYAVTTPSFEFDSTYFAAADVTVGGDTPAAAGLKGTGIGTSTGPLVVAGIGRAEDFPAATGAIVLVERGELTFREKVQNAIAAGAVGVIVYNNEPGAIIGDLDGDVGIPVVGISQEDGASLAADPPEGPSAATITVHEPTKTSYNVVAKPVGATTCETVTGGHYDSVPAVPGADDNASGTAAVLEVARVARARQLAGAHCFVLFGAEEYGLFGGRAFVDSLTDAQVTALRGMVNLDVVGLPQTLGFIGDEALVAEAGVIADGLGLPWERTEVPSGAGSDHRAFQDAGVPVVFLYRHDELIHSPEDAINRIQAQALAEAVEVAAAVLAELEA